MPLIGTVAYAADERIRIWTGDKHGWQRVIWNRDHRRLQLKELSEPERIARQLYMRDRYTYGEWASGKPIIKIPETADSTTCKVS